MTTVKVEVTNNDKWVGAMVKALAVQLAGYEAVRGTTQEFLQNHGYYEFQFLNDDQAKEFRGIVPIYINNKLAVVVD